MSKGQARRLTNQHISSGGASGIFGEDAQAHDQSVGRASKSVFEKLKQEYPKFQFRFRQYLSKQEINEKLKYFRYLNPMVFSWKLGMIQAQ